MNIHWQNFNKAIKNKKLLLVQYSSTDIYKKPISITSFFGLNYFTDEEFGLQKNQENFNQRLKKYFKDHPDYYIAFWNFNSKYGYEYFDIFSPQEIKKMRLTERIIDLDSVFEEYANKNNQEYIEKPRPPFETRYYFALLNNIKTNNNLIWGGIEKDLKSYNTLLDSSREKIMVTKRLIDLLQAKKLKVYFDTKTVKLSKKIVGFKGTIAYFFKNNKKELFLYLGKLIIKFFIKII